MEWEPGSWALLVAYMHFLLDPPHKPMGWGLLSPFAEKYTEVEGGQIIPTVGPGSASLGSGIQFRVT